MSTFRRFDVLTFLIVLCLTCNAHAAQHLVAPGSSWSELGSRVRPGDEIILMPGTHLPASFDELHGTHDKPITIRGLTTNQPSIIEARQHGIRLRRPQHVVIRDLAVTGATVAGIAITNEAFSRDAQRSAPPEIPPNKERSEPIWPAHVVVRNVTIERTGPHGRRHAILLDGVRHVHVERVRLEGWGGSAVKVVASADVRIEHSIMRGRDDHGQLSGVHVRGGSENVRITRCLFVSAGEAAIILGDASASSTQPPAGETAYEARRVIVERNVIRRGDAAFAFLSADQCLVRNNTIIEPKRFGYFVAPPGNLRQTTLGANIFTWKPGALEALAFVASPAKADGLIVEQNLWWSDETQAAIARLGKPAGDVRSPQVMDVDPDFDEQLKPRNRRAQVFGTEGP